MWFPPDYHHSRRYAPWYCTNGIFPQQRLWLSDSWYLVSFPQVAAAVSSAVAVLTLAGVVGMAWADKMTTTMMMIGAHHQFAPPVRLECHHRDNNVRNIVEYVPRRIRHECRRHSFYQMLELNTCFSSSCCCCYLCQSDDDQRWDSENGSWYLDDLLLWKKKKVDAALVGVMHPSDHSWSYWVGGLLDQSVWSLAAVVVEKKKKKKKEPDGSAPRRNQPPGRECHHRDNNDGHIFSGV